MNAQPIPNNDKTTLLGSQFGLTQGQRVAIVTTSLFFLFISLLWNYVAGKDMNWDFMNYHFYGAASIVDGRLSQDYFAASIQSYLNPLPYVPQFLMMRMGWHSLLVGSVLTALHTLNLVLIWKITRLFIPADCKWSDGFYVLLMATALAFASPVHLTELGTSFADILTSLPILLGLYILLQNSANPTFKQAAWAGLLFGLATGAKLTNGTLGLAGLILAAWLFYQSGGFRHAVRGGFVFGAVAGGGLLLTHGYWSYLLWQEFGNPVFPLFNKLFQSPDFMRAGFQDQRFMTDGWLGILMLPFNMTKLASWIYTENISADIRFLALIGLSLAAFAFWAKKQPSFLSSSTWAITNRALPLVALAIFCLVSYLLWGSVFRIGRYGYVIWLLIAPLMAGVLVLAFNANVARVALLVVLICQSFVLIAAGSPRWLPTLWDKDWLSVTAPKPLLDKPHTYFMLGTQTSSAFAPFMHPQSSVINLAGQYNQPAGSNMTAKLKAHIDKPAEQLRVIYRDADKRLAFSQPTERTIDDLDAILSLYGLRVGRGQCDPIGINYTKFSDTLLTYTSTPSEIPAFQGDRLIACPVAKLSKPEWDEALAKEAAINSAFEKVEARCGSQLKPGGMQTMRGLKGWMRGYINTQNSLSSDGKTLFVRPFRSMLDYDLGPLEEWQGAATGRDCPLMKAVRPN